MDSEIFLGGAFAYSSIPNFTLLKVSQRILDRSYVTLMTLRPPISCNLLLCSFYFRFYNRSTLVRVRWSLGRYIPFWMVWSSNIWFCAVQIQLLTHSMDYKKLTQVFFTWKSMLILHAVQKQIKVFLPLDLNVHPIKSFDSWDIQQLLFLQKVVPSIIFSWGHLWM